MLVTFKLIKIAEFFLFDTIKIFVLIISGKISGKLSTGKFNQLSDAIFDKENYFLAIMSRFTKANS